MSATVTRMIDRAPVAVSDMPDLIAWLKEWTEALESGDYGMFRSLVLVVESDAGQVATLSQSIGLVDNTRLAGFLFSAAHRVIDGNTNIARLWQAGE